MRWFAMARAKTLFGLADIVAASALTMVGIAVSQDWASAGFRSGQGDSPIFADAHIETVPRERVSWATDAAFQQQLAEPCDILWAENPLRQAIESLSRAGRWPS